LIGVLGPALGGCEILPRPGDTQGAQTAGRWDQHGRVIVETDPRYTLVHLRVDTNVVERHDVLLARFDFDPSEGDGDEYALTIALDLGDARRFSANHPYLLGDSIPAYATVACLCRPLRPDSVRGTYVMQTRGTRQLAGRIDATLYFTAWDDSKAHATYRLRQRIHGVRP
jgi:YD repeat-containing protein